MSDSSDGHGFRLDSRADDGLPHRDDDVYRDDSSDDTSDSVDPKRLVKTPTIDDIRWYYRNGPIASTVVDKPIQDAFKHGYDVVNDDEDSAKTDFLEEVIPSFKAAHRKARRDGFALLWFRLRDTNKEWEEPGNVEGLHEVKVLTLDDLTNRKPLAFEEKLTAANADNILSPNGANSSVEDISTLRDLATRADDSAIETDGTRIARDSSDPARISADALNDPDIDPDDVDGRMLYGRSRFYDITDNGIVISNRLDDKNFEDPVAYLYSRGAEYNPLMINPNRVYHLTWRGGVDGDHGDTDTYGGYEGDSILRPIIHLLRDIHKANWSISQNLFRHSSPLHVMEYEEGVDDETIRAAEKATQNINAKSSITEPPGFELRTENNESDAPIADSYDVLFDQVCAGTEFTRSVLFGTQAGTVSGSETDIKNYFNQVERLRRNRITLEMQRIVNWYADYSPDDYDFDEGLDLEWGPLFKPTALDRAEAMARNVQTAATATNNYILGVDEVRSMLEEQWTDYTDVQIGDSISDDQMDILDRTNTQLTKTLAGGIVPEGVDLETAAMQQMQGNAVNQGGGEGSSMDDGNPRVGQNGGGNN